VKNLTFIVGFLPGPWHDKIAFVAISTKLGRGFVIEKDGGIINYNIYSYPDYCSYAFPHHPRVDFVQACERLNPDVSISARVEIYKKLLELDAMVPKLPAIIIGGYEVEFLSHDDSIKIGNVVITRKEIIEIANRMGIITNGGVGGDIK